MELIKLVSGDAKKYYLRSDQEVTGYYTSSNFEESNVIDFKNKKLNEELNFKNGVTSSTVYVLLYSDMNAIHLGEGQGAMSRLVSGSDRILTTDYNGTNLYISEHEMDDQFVSSNPMEWYWYLLMALAALILLALLIFLIVCCCCGKDEEPRSIGNNTTSGSYYQDTFMKPVIGKMSNDKVKQYYTEDNTAKSGFTNDL